MRPLTATLAPLAAAALLAACATGPAGPDARTATIQRTANGVAAHHRPRRRDPGLRHGLRLRAGQRLHDRRPAGHRARRACALVRRRHAGPAGATHVPERADRPVHRRAHGRRGAGARLGHASAESQAMARGAVAGYNRYLADQAGKLPAACNGQPWVKPMTLAEFRRQGELTAVQAATAALADAMLGAKPPAAAKSSAAPAAPVNLADAADAMREAGLLDSPLGSNAWAFGKDTTANGSGLLLGNPHFPLGRRQPLLAGAPDHPRQPGRDGRGHRQLPGVTIGFNKDVAWSHTVSTGKRFTLHELTLAEGDPTTYLIDGKPEKMTSRTVSVPVRAADGSQQTQVGHAVVHPLGPGGGAPARRPELDRQDRLRAQGRQPGQCACHRHLAGLWPRAQRAGGARGHEEHRHALGQHHGGGPPRQHPVRRRPAWCPTSMRRSCSAVRPASPPQALLRPPAWWCWTARRAHATGSATPPRRAGADSLGRMPTAIRTDWVHNSNDSFFYTHPAEVERHLAAGGHASVTRPRTRPA
jgi:acyl-homoserine-lactone acylase